MQACSLDSTRRQTGRPGLDDVDPRDESDTCATWRCPHVMSSMARGQMQNELK
jgi:hypothetical protein